MSGSYSLLPPPAVNMFTRHPGDRLIPLDMILGAAEPVQAVRAWLHAGCDIFFQPWANSFLHAFAGMLALEILIGFFFLFFKWISGGFWLFRVLEDGLIVPNSIVTYFVMAQPYLAVALALAVVFSHPHRPEDFANPESLARLHIYNAPAWLGLPWLGLMGAVVCLGVGALWSLPSTQHPLSHAKDCKPCVRFFRWLRKRPYLLNSLYIVLPGLVLVTVAPPTVAATVSYNRAFDLHLAWLTDYGEATALTNEMLQEAQQIVYTNLEGVYWDCLCMLIWVVWGVLITGFLAICTVKILAAIRFQLQAAEAKVLAASNHPQGASTLPVVSLMHNGSGPESVNAEAEAYKSEHEEKPRMSQGLAPAPGFTEPPSGSSVSLPLAELTKAELQLTVKTLKVVYNTLLMGFGSLVIGSAIFTAVPLYIATSLYPAYETARANDVIQISVVTILFVTVGCGTLAIATITWRPMSSQSANGASVPAGSGAPLASGRCPLSNPRPDEFSLPTPHASPFSHPLELELAVPAPPMPVPSTPPLWRRSLQPQNRRSVIDIAPEVVAMAADHDQPYPYPPYALMIARENEASPLNSPLPARQEFEVSPFDTPRHEEHHELQHDDEQRESDQPETMEMEEMRSAQGAQHRQSVSEQQHAEERRDVAVDMEGEEMQSVSHHGGWDDGRQRESMRYEDAPSNFGTSLDEQHSSVVGSVSSCFHSMSDPSPLVPFPRRPARHPFAGV